MKKLNKNTILIIGSLIVVFFACKWYIIEQKNGNPSLEPTVTLAAALLTLTGYFIASQPNKTVEPNDKQEVQQNHSGKGDNVAGNKIVNYK